ncbi:MAG TPA: 50S ribosomal protein L25 [Vicinamibacterales bacterium]|nr:50S ribosomal protein L25 [Vicinamibacterales bacterium]
MEAVLEATIRESRGKNEARRTRAGGKVPAVVYGMTGSGKTEATAIAIEPKALTKILHSEAGANTLISLKLAGAGDTRVLMKDYQLDPITHQVLHADFYRIAMDKVLRITVPITVKGEAPGVKQQGGILEFVHRQVEVECLPADIPEHIEINVGELMLHQGVRVRDLPANPKVKPVSDGDMMIVHVIMPKAEEAAAPAAAEGAVAAAPAAPAEPEVIKKGKKEEAEEKE